MDYLWIAATAIVVLVLLQVLWMAVDFFRRSAHENAQRAREAQWLQERISQVQSDVASGDDDSSMWSGWRKFEVARKEPEPGQICSFYLEPHDGKKPLPLFKPGQYLTFQLNLPDQPKPLVRCYSLSDGIEDDHYRVSIKRVPPPRDKPDVPPGKGSNFFHDHVNEGDIIDVKAPGGHFFLDLNRDSPIVLIGGGIGITPVLSMLNTLVKVGSLTREVYFFVGVRNSRDHPFKEHMERLNAEHEKLHLHVCYSKPGEADVEGRDYQHAARVSVDLFKEVLPSNNFNYYLCGPPPLMESVVPAIEEWGVPESHIHYEAFGPASVKKVAKTMDHLSPKEAEDKASASGGLEVVFAKSGQTHKWNAVDGPLLDFAEAKQIHIDSGCRAGNCGTCVVAIKEGDVLYETDLGADLEEGSCLVCCCVPKSKLVLDA